MSIKSIKWLPNSVLRTNVDYSRKVYSFFEEDFSKCVEYVALDEKHLDVYSYRLSDLILRIGPEVLRVFNLILFNPRRSELFEMQPDLADKILSIQTSKDARKDSFMAYLDAVCAGPMYKLADERIELKAIPKYIVPFEVEKRVKNGQDFKVVFWWEDGYNALRHRVIDEFKTSATLKNALFSLCALWVLHNILDFDGERPGLAKSEFFEAPFTFRDSRSKAEKLK